MRQPALLTAALLSVSSFVCLHAQTTTWSLDDCVRYAMENNIQVKQSQNSVESAEADVKSSKAALFPSLSFSSNQQWGFQKVSSQSYTTMDATPKNPTYTGSYGLSARMTLFNGGSNYYTLKKNKLTRESSALDAQKTANSIQVQIIQAYYQILYAHESVQTDEEIVAVAQQELDRTKAKLDVGKATKVDVAQMESQLQQHIYQLVTARNQEASNLLSLKKILQISPENDFAINYQDFSQEDVMSVIPTLAEAEQLALNNLPDVKSAEVQAKAAEIQTKIARASYMPTLSLSGNVGTSNGNTFQGTFKDQVSDHLSESVGLSLSVPILDNRSARTSVEKAKIQYANALLNQEDARLTLENTIATLHLDIQSAQARYKSALASEESTHQSYNMMSERYNVGLENLIDLLNQKNTYLQAVQERLQAKYTALLDLELMDFYTGK